MLMNSKLSVISTIWMIKKIPYNTKTKKCINPQHIVEEIFLILYPKLKRILSVGSKTETYLCWVKITRTFYICKLNLVQTKIEDSILADGKCNIQILSLPGLLSTDHWYCGEDFTHLALSPTTSLYWCLPTSRLSKVYYLFVYK